MDDFTTLKTFLDITDTTIAATQTKNYQASNRNISPHTVSSAATGGTVVREVTQIEIVPPRDANGNFEDLREIWFQLDGADYHHYLSISGVGTSLMAPVHTQLAGGRGAAIAFGTPFWKLCKDSLDGHPAGNMPILNSTPKFGSRIEMSVRSLLGVTGAGSGGWRVIVKGYEYTPAALAYLAAGWKNDVSQQTIRRTLDNKPPLDFTFVPAGQITPETWASLPGGTKQGSIKINPYWHFAYNNQATQPDRPYVYSNETTVGGASNNIEDTFQDLGFPFANSNDAFLLRGFGVRGVGSTPAQNLARAGWFLNGNEIPTETGASGLFVTAGLNDLTFGDVSPLLAIPNLFFPIPRWQGELLLAADNGAPFIGGNGAAVPADSVMVALNGVLVERG